MKLMTHHPCKISQEPLRLPRLLLEELSLTVLAFTSCFLPGGPQMCQAPDPFFEEALLQHNPC